MTNIYENMIQTSNIERDLYRSAAVSSRLQKGDIKTAEFIAGKKFVPDLDPIQETISKQQIEKTTEPIVKQIESLKATRTEPRVEQGPETIQIEQAPPEDPEPSSEELFNEDEVRLLEAQYFTPKILELTDKEVLEKYKKKFGETNQSLNGQMRNKSLSKNQKRELKAKMRVNKILVGEIKTKLRTLQQSGSGICKNVLKDKRQRLEVLLGELGAGNNSKVLKNEALKIVYYLFKQNQIPKSVYKKIISIINI